MCQWITIICNELNVKICFLYLVLVGSRNNSSLSKNTFSASWYSDRFEGWCCNYRKIGQKQTKTYLLWTGRKTCKRVKSSEICGVLSSHSGKVSDSKMSSTSASTWNLFNLFYPCLILFFFFFLLFIERIEECFWWSNISCLGTTWTGEEEKVCASVAWFLLACVSMVHAHWKVNAYFVIHPQVLSSLISPHPPFIKRILYFTM